MQSGEMTNATWKLYFTGMGRPLIVNGCVIWGNCGHCLLMNVHKMMKQYA